MASSSEHAPLLPGSLRARLHAWLLGMLGWMLLALCVAASLSLLTWSAADPSFIRTASGATRNALGPVGANVADIAMRLLGLAAVAIVLPPLFWALHHPTSAAWNFGGQLGFAVCIGLFGGAIPVTMVETTPHAVRCSAISVGYNLCVGILGGASPLVATWLIQRTHDDLSPAYFVMTAALISLVAAVTMLESSAANAPEAVQI